MPAIDLAQLGELLERSNERTTGYPAPVQEGPLRFVETKGFCSEGCRSPTYVKIRGEYHCLIHAVRKLNDLLIAEGVLS